MATDDEDTDPVTVTEAGRIAVLLERACEANDIESICMHIADLLVVGNYQCRLVLGNDEFSLRLFHPQAKGPTNGTHS